MKHVLGVAKEIGENIEDYILIATKSTVPIGTAKKVKQCVWRDKSSLTSVLLSSKNK